MSSKASLSLLIGVPWARFVSLSRSTKFARQDETVSGHQVNPAERLSVPAARRCWQPIHMIQIAILATTRPLTWVLSFGTRKGKTAMRTRATITGAAKSPMIMPLPASARTRHAALAVVVPAYHRTTRRTTISACGLKRLVDASCPSCASALGARHPPNAKQEAEPTT